MSRRNAFRGVCHVPFYVQTKIDFDLLRFKHKIFIQAINVQSKIIVLFMTCMQLMRIAII